MVCTSVECSPEWGKPLFGIFGVKVALDPVHVNCEAFVGYFLENSNPKVTIGGSKSMRFAFIVKLDIDND